jgi:hypothetical protein
MKLNFCAVCGATEGLHQHHIEPVVRTGISRTKARGYSANKKLQDCTSAEVFAWLFDQGIITDDGEITVCDYHHNILHGIVKFQQAQHNSLIKLGLEKARAKGVTLGRPTKIDKIINDEVLQLRKNGIGIKSIATQLKIGVGTVYKIIEGNYILPVIEKKERTFADLYD